MKTIIVCEELKIDLPRIKEGFAELKGNLADIEFQKKLRNYLMSQPSWSKWIKKSFGSIDITPYHVKEGLGINKDDWNARMILVGLALSIEPDNFVPPYGIGGMAVTEVIAEPSATKESHSQNDLPAPPHVAGFFEDTLPHTCYFACVRQHIGGGAETTVINLKKILAKASVELIKEWSSKKYHLRTSKRLGMKVYPFTLLQYIEGKPFLRYRKEYTEGFNEDNSLIELEKLLLDKENHFAIRLESDEILVHWNGAPHSRLKQIGETPQEIEKRRKLIRCRSQPYENWDYFKYDE